MSIGQLIHDKLITDFAALKFENNTTSIFNNVKKFYAASSQKPQDCLIKPDSNNEIVSGQSAGNTATTRVYTYAAIFFEQVEASTTDNEGSIKYQRLMNTLDGILNYIQREPSNLRSWGISNGIDIFKTRLNNVRFGVLERSEGGFVEVGYVLFSVYLNITPQLL